MSDVFTIDAKTKIARIALGNFIRIRKRRRSRDRSRDEFSWQQFGFLRGRRATLRTRWNQLLRVRLDSLGDMQAAFGREGEEEIPKILERLVPGDTVLDIGAHIGGFSLIAARAVGATGHVFAFEPVADNIELLKENKAINGAESLVPIHAAVGRKIGSIELFVSDTDTMWATTRVSWSNVLHHGTAPAHIKPQRVALLTVDDFVREQSLDRIALVKIDVEAAEMDVLAGAAETLAAGIIEQLVVEVHGPAVKWSHVSGLLQQYGYEIQEIGLAEMYARRLTQSRTIESSRAKPVTIALIGCGAVSEQHYSVALEALSNAGVGETLAVVDPQQERCTKLLEYFPTARPYSDLDGMLKETVPELAIIAVPHQLHANLTERCLDNGIHVLCEKPMAITTAECDRMLAAAERTRRILAVGHFRRFYRSCEVVKRFLDSDCLGKVESFQFFEGYRYNWPLTSGSVFTRSTAGGGVLIDTGAHALDLVMWWLGDVSDVSYRDDAMGGVEANCELDLKMKNGATGHVRLSRDWGMPNYCLIKAEKGWIRYTCDVTDSVEWGFWGDGETLRTQIESYEVFPPPSQNPLLNYFAAQVRNVVDAVRGRATVRVSGAEARKVVALIESCYASRAMLRMNWLGENELRRATELAHVH